jgi:transcriptional regulator with XRE-family HTH domain
MTGAELRAIREARGETQAQFGLALGYRGSNETRKTMICQFERNKKPIPWRVIAELLGARCKIT